MSFPTGVVTIGCILFEIKWMQRRRVSFVSNSLDAITAGDVDEVGYADTDYLFECGREG